MNKHIYTVICIISLNLNILAMQPSQSKPPESHTRKNSCMSLNKDHIIDYILIFKGFCKIYCNGYNFKTSQEGKIIVTDNSTLILFEPGETEITGNIILGTIDKENGTESFTARGLTIIQPTDYDSLSQLTKEIMKR
ncbi:MAG: hypothetical protein ABIF12_02675 [bacterium]